MAITTAITETPGVSGGYPCIAGTRIPVRTVVRMYAITSDVAEVAEELPQLTREQIEAALAYYADHPDRVDDDIARNEAALAQLRL